MRLSSSYLADAARYERATHGWVDAPRDDTFTMTVRIADPWVSVELVAVTTPSPGYAIQSARPAIASASAWTPRLPTRWPASRACR